jgi:hypothetical protein
VAVIVIDLKVQFLRLFNGKKNLGEFQRFDLNKIIVLPALRRRQFKIGRNA